MSDIDEQSIPSRGSHGDIVSEAKEWLARSRAAKPLPSERIIAGLLERATLTDEEREALRRMLRRARENYWTTSSPSLVQDCAVIDGILERLG